MSLLFLSSLFCLFNGPDLLTPVKHFELYCLWNMICSIYIYKTWFNCNFHYLHFTLSFLTFSWVVVIWSLAPLRSQLPPHGSLPPPPPPPLPSPPDAARPGGCGWGRRGKGRRLMSCEQASPGRKERKARRRRNLSDCRPQIDFRTRWRRVVGGRRSSPERCPEPRKRLRLPTIDSPKRTKKKITSL